jgi:putative heme iron utilization protein
MNDLVLDGLKFKLPKGLDLHDTKKVRDWWIGFGTLYIILKDGRTLHIGCEFDEKW